MPSTMTSRGSLSVETFAARRTRSLARWYLTSAIPFETDTPTTHQEHIFFVHELRRLGVQWVSLAPRYIGRFEKGVDYIGDLGALRSDLSGHAAISRALGPYKLSLHSGSDKFSVYPIITEMTGGRVPPTAGASGRSRRTSGTSSLQSETLGTIPTYTEPFA